MIPREFWICDSGFSEWPVTPEKPTDKHHPTMHMGEELADCDCTSCVDWTHVREVLPNEPDYKALAQELVNVLEVAYKTFHILCATSLSSANTPPAMEMMREALDKARKAGIE